MKVRRLTAALCALAVVVSSSGGLPFGGLRLFDTAVTASAATFEGDGSATSPYLIASAADWNALADAVNSGESYSGKYFKLTEDISVSTMVGRNNHDSAVALKPFSGTFDGDGHVLTVNINSTSTHGAAPFCGVQNAVIKNLKVEGSVVGGIHSSGLVGTTSSNDSGTLTIENVVVNADVSGNTHLGGVVGHGFGTNITLKNVSYGGKVAGTNFSGGLVGWCGPNAKLTAENCSFSGTYSGKFHPIGFAYSSGTAKVTNFYTTITATNTSNQYTYTGGLTQNTVSITAPTSKTNLTSSGDDVELINAGSTNVGTMKYSLDGRNYSEEIPKAAAGEHSVWYRVEVNDNYISEKRIKVNVLHAHAFTYTADGDTITAQCNDDCDITEGLTMKISAPTDLKANGSPKEATLSTGYNTTAFPDEYTIEYYKGEEKLDGAPSAGGHYTAKVTAGTATASVDFTIVIDPAYTITIPAEVNLNSSDPVSIEAEGVELNEGQKIVVTLDGASHTTSGNVFNAMNDDSVVTYKINGGNVGLGDNNTVAEFTDNGSAGLSFAVDSTDGIKLAGAHTETLTFGVALEQSEPATVAVSSITIDNAPTEALFVNSTGTLTATVSPDNATDKTVVWSSSDPDYVSINAETGEYTVMGKKGYGSATITATATNGTENTSDDVKATCTITGKVTYTSLSVGTVLHTGDTFYTGSTVYFQGSTAASFTANMGVITIIEATKSGYNNKYYQCQRGSNGTYPNWAYVVKDNTDGIYITGGSGTKSDKFTLAVHTK